MKHLGFILNLYSVFRMFYLLFIGLNDLLQFWHCLTFRLIYLRLMLTKQSQGGLSQIEIVSL